MEYLIKVTIGVAFGILFWTFCTFAVLQYVAEEMSDDRRLEFLEETNADAL